MGFSQQYLLSELYENGDAELRVYDHRDGSKRWIVKAGIGVLEFDAEQFADFAELIIAYIDEAYPEDK